MDLDKFLLEENVGGWDLWIRAVLGSLAIVVLAMGMASSPWNYVAAVIAFVGLFTGIMRHCSLYPLLGINTKR